jgi:hypothetical protein
MKKLYGFYKSKAFLLNTILFLLVLSIFPINDKISDDRYIFFESIRVTQMLISILLALFFYIFFASKHGRLNSFYKSDKFYCDLMYITTISGVSFTIHYINWETINVHSAIKIWEIAAYSVTLIYTFWLWLFKNGRNIFLIIEYKNIAFWEKVRFVLAIGGALVTLFLIVVGHIFITFGSNHEYLRHYSILFSVGLILLTYFLFVYISNKVINLTEVKLHSNGKMTQVQKQEINFLNSKIEDYYNEFSFGLKYTDRPMKWVFLIMFIYATYTAGLDFFAAKNIMLEIEVFFGGAIAFELLLSSVIWAQKMK